MCEGRVLFHSHVHKSAEESAAQQEEVDERDRLKAERRRQQARTCRICIEHWHHTALCPVLQPMETWRRQ